MWRASWGVLAAALVAGCAAEGPVDGVVAQREAAGCCLGMLSGDIVGAPGCAGAAVTAVVDEKATLTLGFCEMTACEARCAPLWEPRSRDFGSCVRACSDPRYKMP